MKAAYYSEYGGPEKIHIKDVEKPAPKENEVLIKVRACSINDWDWGLLSGTPWKNGKKPKYSILGSDVAGTIEATGPGVSKFKVGDSVFGDLSGRWGGFAEYVCAPEKMLAIKPASMSFEEASAIPQAGMLMVQGLNNIGKMKPGQKVLINGAGGGVGTFGIQLAKMVGVETTGVDAASKLEMLRGLGYDHVIDYKTEDFTKTGRRYDLILDAKTTRSPFDYIRALNPGGTYATIGGSIPKVLVVFLLGGLIRLFTGKRMRVVVLKPNKDLEYMKSLFEAGKMKAIIDGPYKLEDIRTAFEVFAAGEHKGKMIITIQ